MKLKILINAIILSSKNTGLGVYTYNLLESISPKLKDNNIEFDILVSNSEFLPLNCRSNAKIVVFKGFLQRNKILKKIDLSEYDLVWSTTQHGNKKLKCHQIITIHDLIPYFFPKGRIHQYVYYKFFLPKILKDCDYVFTVSENTKNDISKIYNYDKSKIVNAYEAIKYQNNGEVKILDKYEHFSVTGIHYSYKNIQLVIEAFHKYEDLRKYKVFIIGNNDCEYGKILSALIEKYSLNECFIFTGFISNEEKNRIISTSIASIYPSFYEGFGLPILEAMDLGVPVLSSNSSSLPEVGGDASIYFNPNNVDELYEKIKFVINCNNREEIIKKGFLNLKRFSWDKSSQIILEKIMEFKSN